MEGPKLAFGDTKDAERSREKIKPLICLSSGVNMTTGMLKVVAPPQITTPPTDQRVTEGAFVELRCETVGIPAPEVGYIT